MINQKSIVQRNQLLIGKKIRGEFVILDLAKGKIYQLNPTAEAIWKYLWKKRTLEEIITKIASEFIVAEKKASKEVMFFIKKYHNALFYFFND